MNLRQHTPSNTNESKVRDVPWYQNPETTKVTPAQTVQTVKPTVAQETPQVTQATQTLTPKAPAPPQRFEQSQAERIISRASILQDTHRQTLTREQIEAIAAEVGIKPEFVHQAMAQELAGTLAPVGAVRLEEEQTATLDAVAGRRIAAAVATYGIFATTVMTLFHRTFSFDLVIWIAFILPAMLALMLGMMARSRRWGAASGVALGVTVIAAAGFSSLFSGESLHTTPEDWQIFAALIFGGVALGAIGAEGRRQVSRRLVKNRSHRTVTRA